MSNDRPHVEFEITTVGGGGGERLAALLAGGTGARPTLAVEVHRPQ
jgi:hypothetical protein